jgi:hypothetical protein
MRKVKAVTLNGDGDKHMLIKKLNATSDAITQAAIVSTSRASARKAISKMSCPNTLLSYSARLYRISKEHRAANSLQREAELATQKATEIRSQPEYVAWTVIEDGCAFFKSNGRCPPKGRLTQMYNRYGSWALVHKRIIEKGFGGKNFLWLRDQNKLELTSEWFIARHAPELVNAETRAALNALLAPPANSKSLAA